MLNSALVEEWQACASDCAFCDSHLGASQSIFDRALHETESLRLLPALGMLVPGYFLAVTRRHVLSTADLPIAERREFHTEAVRLSRALGSYFGQYLLFEHGSCATSGSCISHAHIHLIPAEAHFEQDLLTRFAWKRINGPGALDMASGLEYGYLRTWSGEHFLYDGRKLPSQWIRQMLAAYVGADIWDWALESGAENLRTTLARLRVDDSVPSRHSVFT